MAAFGVVADADDLVVAEVKDPVVQGGLLVCGAGHGGIGDAQGQNDHGGEGEDLLGVHTALAAVGARNIRHRGAHRFCGRVPRVAAWPTRRPQQLPNLPGGMSAYTRIHQMV
ncbi:hypothetical protein FNV64_01490 [Streptomyces sp. S1A1-7]|nr:hypothetical protein FNV64_01490 [Streptomyces sp. S1A1-7]QDN93580.1 hypothetical protein FNV61_57095 [Streptomyces sp. RLB3-6]QDO05032.1 hypothetical protein FNV68_00205 [Streptomyces sp. S1D4-23]